MSIEGQIRKKLQHTHPFQKAFMGRIDTIVPFFPMSKGHPDDCLLSAETTVIAKYMLEREQERLAVHQVMNAETKDDIADIIVRDAVEESGARGIEKLAKEHISNRVMHSLLKEKGGIEENCTLTYSADRDQGTTEFRVSEYGQQNVDSNNLEEWADGAFD